MKKIELMRYYLFLDESGDHGLSNIDKHFPIFLLCGVLISQDNYLIIRDKLNGIKEKFWKNKNVVFHSRDIRRCEKDFQILIDKGLRQEFINDINGVIKGEDYQVIAAGIDKKEYIERYGKLQDVYQVSLSFVLERTLFCLDGFRDCEEIRLIIEKRGKKEDQQLNDHIYKLLQVGTHYVESKRFRNYGFKPHFLWKTKNINGLQLSDLLAYPIARNIINSEAENLSFDILKGKIYSRNGLLYGLKKFP